MSVIACVILHKFYCMSDICMCDTALVACVTLLLLHVWYCCCCMRDIAVVACVILLLLHAWYCCCCMRDIAVVACVTLLLLHAWYLLLLHAWYCYYCMCDVATVACMISLSLHAWYCLQDCMRDFGVLAAAAYLGILMLQVPKFLTLSVLYHGKWYVAGFRLDRLQETKFPVMCNHYAIQCLPLPHFPTLHLPVVHAAHPQALH